MGKARSRRFRHQARVLGELARTSIDCFEEEWVRRLEGWLRGFRAHAQRLLREDGQAERPLAESTSEILELLEACGPEAAERVGEDTREILANETCKAIAQAVDPHLWRFHSAESARRASLARLLPRD